jgi:hypothetical protein
MHLFFFIGVTEDDDFTIIGWPMDVTIEVAKELFGELFILRAIRDEILLI